MEQFLILSGLNFLTFYSYNSESFSKEYVVNLFISLPSFVIHSFKKSASVCIDSKKSGPFIIVTLLTKVAIII